MKIVSVFARFQIPATMNRFQWKYIQLPLYKLLYLLKNRYALFLKKDDNKAFFSWTYLILKFFLLILIYNYLIEWFKIIIHEDFQYTSS
jgi:hypothetical protein